MRGPKPARIELTHAERQALDELVRRHSTAQQIALRVRSVLLAAEGYNNAQIARQVGISIDMARLWRERWLALQPANLEDLPAADRLSDAPRPGKPRRITAEQVCRIVELACEAPERSGRLISQWTAREIADEIKGRGIVEEISDELTGVQALERKYPALPMLPGKADSPFLRTHPYRGRLPGPCPERGSQRGAIDGHQPQAKQESAWRIATG
jgi:putative transposase